MGNFLKDTWEDAGDVLEKVGDVVVSPFKKYGPGEKYQIDQNAFLMTPEYEARRAEFERMIKDDSPSPAEIMAKNEGAKIARDTMAAMASQRGVNPALAARTAANIGAQSRAEMAGQASLVRAQEEQQKKQNYAALLGLFEADRQAKIDQQKLQAKIDTDWDKRNQAAKQNQMSRILGVAGRIGTGLTKGGTQMAANTAMDYATQDVPTYNYDLGPDVPTYG